MSKHTFRFNYSDRADFSQPLVDISTTGKERNWKFKKNNNDMLAYIYDSIDPAKAERLRNCSSFLIFGRTKDNQLKLKKMNSCRVRLCPVCAWRRSLKIYSHMTKIMNYVQESDCYEYLFITLTVKNCYPEELNDHITLLLQSWQRFIQRKEIKNICIGSWRGLEITYNDLNNTFHPHFHVIFCVNKNYFKKNYMSQARFTDLWKDSLRADYTPIVNVKKVKGNTTKAVAECAKYAVKDTDYIRPDDLDLSQFIVEILDKALDGRRLISYTGLFKDIHLKLNLDDEIDGDLIHVDNDDHDDFTNEEILYVWHVGYNNYFRSKL